MSNIQLPKTRERALLNELNERVQQKAIRISCHEQRINQLIGSYKHALACLKRTSSTSTLPPINVHEEIIRASVNTETRIGFIGVETDSVGLLSNVADFGRIYDEDEVKTSGGTLQSFIAQKSGKEKNKHFLADTDVRASILSHAEAAEKDPQFVAKAYLKNQPVPIFQERSTAPEDEESDEELEPVYKMPRGQFSSQ